MAAHGSRARLHVGPRERDSENPPERQVHCTTRRITITEKYKVSGMPCGGCARSVTNAILAKVGQAKVDVDLPTGTVSVAGGLSVDQVKDAVEGAGFDFQGKAA